MNLELENRRDTIRPVDLLALLVFEGQKPRLPRGVRLAGHVTEAFRGEFRELRATDPLDGNARRVLLIGLGKRDALDLDRLRRLAALAVKEAERGRARSLGLWLDPDVEAAVERAEAVGQALAEGARLGSYSYQE